MMSTENLLPLTPEQIQVLSTGHGIARFVDPVTQKVYAVTESITEMTHSDEYIREKLDEARKDIAEGRFAEGFCLESLLIEARRRKDAIS